MSNRIICKHRWIKKTEWLWWCDECGVYKEDDCGAIHYHYPKRIRHDIWGAGRKNGKPAKRKKTKKETK